MTDTKSLRLKLGVSIAVAFVASMAVTWFFHAWFAERDAYKLIDRTFANVSQSITDRINQRMIRKAMQVRDYVTAPDADTSPAALRRLAEELQLDEVCVAGPEAKITHSSVEAYIGFDFRKNGEQPAEFMSLLHDKTEFAQLLRRNGAGLGERKYVGVWLPQGGFVQIGCNPETVRNLSRSSLTGFTRHWGVGEGGAVVITARSGLIISDLAEFGREGSLWTEPGDDCYWKMKDVEGFPVYIVIPKKSAAITRDTLVVMTAVLNGAALIFVAILVGFVISRYVRNKLREQAAKELATASRIQLSAIPTTFPPFPHETEFDIYASMHTAKNVGGDFYDFFFSGPHTLTFLIADVSGKGVPAALFMMQAKSYIKAATQTGKSLEEAVAEANDRLCEGNEENMFVTAWIGQLDIKTGKVNYVNAGHNPPLMNGQYVRGRAGLVLGAMSGIRYRTQELQLQPGDRLYLYTDGITEQIDPTGALYGEDRLQKLIATTQGSLKETLEAVRDSVLAYAGGTEQVDDCTQLVLKYRGPTKTVRFEYLPTMDDLKKATADLEQALESVPMKEQMNLMVAADEIFANIVRYSDATKWSLTIKQTQHPTSTLLVFEDDGKPFDPLLQRDPDTTLSAEERKIGGLGILIVKKTMSPVTYARVAGKNILTMGKSW